MNKPPTEIPPGGGETAAKAAVFLCGFSLLAFPVAPQLRPYTPESALAGAAAVLFVLFAAGTAWQKKIAPPTPLLWGAVLWAGLWICGALRSPYPGRGLPQATDAVLFVLLAVAGYGLAAARPAVLRLAVRLTVAVVAVEAAAGVCQRFLDLPRLRAELAGGQLAAPPALTGVMGRQRLFSNEVFATFTNANAYGVYLACGLLLLLGPRFAGRRGKDRPPARKSSRAWTKLFLVPCAGLFGFALYLSGSKGAWAALPFGGWCFFLQGPFASATPRRRRGLKTLTVAGLLVGLGLLAAETAGWLGEAPFGESLRVRCEYRRTAVAALADRPLLGHGAGSFGDVYPFYQPPAAEWAAAAHNDWLELGVELGLLGPLVYGLLWLLLLKKETPAATTTAATAAATKKKAPVTDSAGERELGRWMLAGAALVYFFLAGLFGLPTGGGLRLILFYPALFLLVYFASGRLLPPAAGDAALRRAVRAAAALLLVHQLVDYDLWSRGVTGTVFLLAGMTLAGGRKRPVAPETAPADTGTAGGGGGSKEYRRRLLGWMGVAGGAVLLSPTAIFSPAWSGAPRRAVEGLRKETARGKRAATALKAARAAELVRECETAAFWAPWDAEAVFDLADAYAVAGRPKEAAAADQRGAALRPLHVGTWLRLGHAALARNDFAAARAAFLRAVERAPYRPLCRLLLGDALLLSGGSAAVAEAAAEYRRAWETDREVFDPGARLLSWLTDPWSGASTRHSREGAVLRLLTKALSAPVAAEVAAAAATEKKRDGGGRGGRRILSLRAALLVRAVGARAALWRGAQRAAARATRATEKPRLKETGGEALRRARQKEKGRRAALLRDCLLLARAAPEDGHAALFAALALSVLPDEIKKQAAAGGKVLPTGKNKPAASLWRAAREKAWARARELQVRSVARGRPDTAPLLFKRLEKKWTPQYAVSGKR